MIGRAPAEVALGAQRHAFDIPADVAYFNTASLSPQLHRVRLAGERALERRGRPWTIEGSDWFSDVERLRTLFGRLIGADADGIAIVPATSYGFSVAWRNLDLRPADRILVLAGEFPSGILSWRTAARKTGAEIVTVAPERGQSWTDAILAALDERIRVVSVPNVHTTDGALIDLEAVADRAHALACRLVIDACQSVGVMPLDVKRLRPDFLVTVGYKWLLGPFGLSYLFVAEEHRDGEPIEDNWISRAGAEDFTALMDYEADYQPGARRFDMGQRTSFHLTPMAISALEQLLEWEVPRIAATVAETTAALAARAADLGLVPPPPGRRGPHILGLELPKDARERLPAALASANCYAAVRGGRSLRIASHVHVTSTDIDRLMGALAEALGDRA
ncbi:MAG: aminotransferase class V-fold PLP-dependent enzyme [Thermoleophilaceae bacterium]|nr:aminotransferase class V-fold PLP-dependent enzyme [Thermoleophilaceae bacterium]